ncbi:acyl transferase [Parapedobacter deserti]|uniref:Acyl transferase n=1 Tax=Parapedobacter deserti TaxID=1912957 RepID=A0ABV7JLT4_9SPHI
MTWADRITSISSPQEFEAHCLDVFALQARNCTVYANYLALLNVKVHDVACVADIPFLPIEFFKTQQVISSGKPPQLVFSSSGTTGTIPSKHYVADVALYERSFRAAFEKAYGPPSKLAVLALLPSYSEREGSSLIYMVDDLIRQSKHPMSGYFLYNHSQLYDTLQHLKATDVKTLLIGVTYALLDFAENYQLDFPDLLVMETGGMKGRRREMVREEVHERLCEGFNVQCIHSEYGMTELLSQAYSAGGGLFQCPPWMKVVIRDTNDPFSLLPMERTGAISLIDLANVFSCSFIATHDLGRIRPDGRFEVLGRFDHSDIRGCNLLVG